MDRTLAGRSPFALPLPRIGGVAGSARSALHSAWRHRRTRIALLVALAALPLLVGGWVVVRKSPFVAVEHVQISGVHGSEAAAIDAALTSAARHMSTLAVHTGALREAVSRFAVVRSVHAIPRFPHGLRIEVVEQPPVAALLVAGARTAVAGDGVVLGPSLLSSSLPTVTGYHEPLPGQRVQGPDVSAAVTVLGAAPTLLRHAIARVFTGSDGLTVAFRNGLLAYFGDATLPHAKWTSLARVLADSSSQGASYVDVRLPERPAAGFPAGVRPPDASALEASSTGEPTSASEATVSSIAASLADSAGGSAAASASGSSSAPSTTGGGSEAAAPASQTSGEEPTAPSGEATHSAEPTGG